MNEDLRKTRFFEWLLLLGMVVGALWGARLGLSALSFPDFRALLLLLCGVFPLAAVALGWGARLRHFNLMETLGASTLAFGLLIVLWLDANSLIYLPVYFLLSALGYEGALSNVQARPKRAHA